MKPVHQTKFAVDDDNGPNPERGNCLQAALASVFELDLEDVPHFVAMSGQDWWPSLFRWLAGRNIAVEYINAPFEPLNALYLKVGKSPRGQFPHVVVCRNGEVLHDPHPDGTGIENHLGTYLFVVADPARQVAL